MKSSTKGLIFLTSLSFVIGFSVAFTLLGASATAIGEFLIKNKVIISRVAGVVVIIFGLQMMGVLKLSLLYREKRFQVEKKRPGIIGAFIMGLAFAIGWTPCIGPFLGTALSLAAEKSTVAEGMLLLFVFSLGLGIPFLITSLAINLFFSLFERIKNFFHVVEITGGTLLVVIGVLLALGSFTRLARFASGLPDFGLGPNGSDLTLVSAFVAGFLAFLSPCVLPLIPGYISYVSGVSLQDLRKEAG